MSSFDSFARWAPLSASIILFVYFVAAGIRLLKPVGTVSHGSLSYLDGLRAVAAMLVLSGHTTGTIAWMLGNRVPLELADNLGSFGVQIFFSISGFLFTKKIIEGTIGTYENFFLARVRRILPLYSIVIFASVVMVIGLSVGHPEESSIWRKIVQIFLYGIVEAPLPLTISGSQIEWVIGTVWTLRFEWAFYVAVPVLSFFLMSRASVAAAILGVGAYLFAAPDQSIIWLYFFPGVAIAYLRLDRIARYSNFGIVSSILALIGTGIVLVGPVGYTFFRLFEVFLIFVIIVVFRPTILENKNLCFIGMISYSLYLNHLPVLYAGRIFLQRVPWATQNTAVTVSLEFFFISLAVLISVLTFRYVERPFMAKKYNAYPQEARNEAGYRVAA